MQVDANEDTPHKSKSANRTKENSACFPGFQLNEQVGTLSSNGEQCEHVSVNRFLTNGPQ